MLLHDFIYEAPLQCNLLVDFVLYTYFQFFSLGYSDISTHNPWLANVGNI